MAPRSPLKSPSVMMTLSPTLKCVMAANPRTNIGWWQDAGMTTERMEVQRTIAADPATIFRVLCDPQGHVTIDSSGMLMDATGEPVTAVGDTLRRAHGSRGAERLPDGPVRRDRHDHDVRARPRDRVDDRRPDPARRSATSTATRSSPSTTARSSRRTTTGRRSTRSGRRPGSSRSSPRARCGRRSGSSPGRSRGAVSR